MSNYADPFVTFNDIVDEKGLHFVVIRVFEFPELPVVSHYLPLQPVHATAIQINAPSLLLVYQGQQQKPDVVASRPASTHR